MTRRVHPVTGGERGRNAQRSPAGTVPLRGWSAGRFQLEVTVTDGVAAVSIVRVTEFEIASAAALRQPGIVTARGAFAP